MKTKILIGELKKLQRVLKEIPEVRYVGDPILRKQCKKVTKKDFKSGEVKRIVARMKKTMLKYKGITGVGRGLSANQIGIDKSITLVDPFFEEEHKALINPKITKKSKNQISYPELCWSWAGLVTANISRHEKITIEYLDINGKKQTEEVEGISSILYQHEIDHLNGKICTDSSPSPTFRFLDGKKHKPKKIN